MSRLTYNMFNLDSIEVLTIDGQYRMIGNVKCDFFFRVALVEYKNISGKTLQQSIEGEMSGKLEMLLVAIGMRLNF